MSLDERSGVGGAMPEYWRGNEHGTERFKAIRASVAQAFPELRKRQIHRIAIYVLKQRGASFPECEREAASATPDHTLFGPRWTAERVKSDEVFAAKVKS
jgi:hypothetical protein